MKTALVSLFICVMCTWTSSVNADDALDKKIQQTLDKDRVHYHLPALSVALKLPALPIKTYVSGYLANDNKQKITPETYFQIGSITKTVMATIIFQLQEENKLSLTDTVSAWLPQYSRWRKITIADLLRHTSGTANYTDSQDFDNLLRKNPKKYLTIANLVNMAYQRKDVAAPGKKFNYSNTDYLLLGMIAEQAAKQPLQQLFDDYFKKYHLDHTFYTPAGYPLGIKANLARGYNRDGTFRRNRDITAMSMSFGHSSGAMIATPTDLVLWLQQLFNHHIINRASLAQLTSVIKADNASLIDLTQLKADASWQQQPFTEVGLGAGLGLVYFKDYGLAWTHAGGSLGYESLYTYNPCNDVYLVLLYSVKPKQQFIYTHIAADIFKLLKEAKVLTKNPQAPVFCQAV